MAEALQRLGGLYTYDDLAEYQSPLEEPISTTYRGYRIFTNQTWTQGIALLEALNILDGVDLAGIWAQQPPGRPLAGGGLETGLRRPREVRR